jgi:hypothetical protein
VVNVGSGNVKAFLLTTSGVLLGMLEGLLKEEGLESGIVVMF